MRLILGDALEFMRTLETGSIDAVVTDPPFGVQLGLFSQRRRKETKGWFLPGDGNQEAGTAVCSWVLSRGLPIIAFAHPSQPWPGKWDQYLVWDKGPGVGIGGGVTRPWKPTWELIQTANVRFYNGEREDGILQYWVSPNFRKDFEFHPCQKPLPLIRRLVEKITRPGDTVLDPFMGSGTTGVVCKQTGRHFVGVEIDPGYFAVAQKRIAEEENSYPLFRQQELIAT